MHLWLFLLLYFIGTQICLPHRQQWTNIKHIMLSVSNISVLIYHNYCRHLILRHAQLGKKMIQHRCQEDSIQAGIHRLHLVIMMMCPLCVVFRAFGKVNEIGSNKSVVKKGN